MATNKSTIQDIKENKSKFFKSAKETHNSILEGAESIVDSGIATGEKWQKLITKTIKNGEPLVNRQFDMMFETFETLQGQLEKSTGRFRSLVGLTDEDIKDAKEKINNKYKEAKTEFEAKTKQAKNKFGDVVEQAQDKFEGVVDKAQDVITDKIPAMESVINTADKSTSEKEDLKTINGIGPKFEKMLNSVGVNSFADLAKWDAEKLEAALETIGINTTSDKLSDWINQAKKLASK